MFVSTIFTEFSDNDVLILKYMDSYCMSEYVCLMRLQCLCVFRLRRKC